jgi:hypothetical protein
LDIINDPYFKAIIGKQYSGDKYLGRYLSLIDRYPLAKEDIVERLTVDRTLI